MKRLQPKSGLNELDARGVALFVSMIVLAVLSMVGIYAVNSAIIENKLSHNYRSANEALIYAEAAVEYARSYLAGRTNHPVEVGGQFCQNPDEYMEYPPGADEPLAWICIEHLRYESVPSITGGYGRVHYYRITGISPFKDEEGNWIGRREVESVERMLVLVL